ncbi:MAG: hypothetical protein ACXVPQ_08675 [Bacteroidia bacterium]
MKNAVILLALCLLLAISCKKKNTDNTTTPSTTAGQNNPPAPNLVINVPSDASGILIASLIPYTFTNNYTTALGNATAFFYTATGNYNYVDAGTVKCNDSILVKQSGGSYMFSGKPLYQPQSGIEYGSGAVWNVSGSTASAFTFTSSQFPSAATVTSGNLLNKSSNYTLTFSGVSNADSISIYFGCDSLVIRRVVAGTMGAAVYTSTDVASVKKAISTNKGYFNITPYNLKSTTASGKKYYMANANTTTFTVNIQ